MCSSTKTFIQNKSLTLLENQHRKCVILRLTKKKTKEIYNHSVIDTFYNDSRLRKRVKSKYLTECIFLHLGDTNTRTVSYT